MPTNPRVYIVDLVLRVWVVAIDLLNYLLRLGFEYRVYTVVEDRGVQAI